MFPARGKIVLQAAALLLPALLEACTDNSGRGPGSSASSDELVPEVEARVNGEAITRTELESHLPRPSSASASGGAEFRRAVLQELVMDRMVHQTAVRYEITVSDAELDEAVRRQDDGAVRFPDHFCEGCTRTRSSAEFRADLKYPLLESKVFAHYAGQGLLKDDPVTESVIRAYYEAHRDQCRGTYAEDRDKIASMLTWKKRSEDRQQLTRFLYQRSDILPKTLAVMD